MVHRSAGRGTFLLDRVFPGVGRIKRASGTNDRRVYDALNAMLSQLWAAGRIDVLASLRDRKVHPLVIWGQVRSGGVALLPSVDSVEVFDPFAWLEARECSDWHRKGMHYRFTRFLKDVGPMTIADLPTKLAAFRTLIPGKPALFNRTKAALQAYLKARFGRHHVLWMGVANVPALKEVKKHGNPQTPQQLEVITRKMGALAPMVWSMALTGMGPGEYWGKWQTVTGAVEIKGTKREGRHRLVPILGDLSRPTVTYKPFRVALAEASDDQVEPYDLRRSFAVWCEHAGVERTHIELYLGHTPHSVTDRYLWREAMQVIPGDGRKVRAWLAKERRGVRRA